MEYMQINKPYRSDKGSYLHPSIIYFTTPLKCGTFSKISESFMVFCVPTHTLENI